MLARNALLLVIDNFEQVLDAAPELSRLLAALAAEQARGHEPRRAADRRRARARACRRWPPSPPSSCSSRRARALDPRLRSATGDDARIEQICARLDGLPLAIELAAARMKVLTPAAILERLGAPARPAQRRPARRAARASRRCAPRSAGATTCSTPTRRRLFERLGVFAGGFTLEAAEAVCGLGRARRRSPRWSSTACSPAATAASRCSRRCASTRSTGWPRRGDARRGPPRAHARLPRRSSRAARAAWRAPQTGEWLDRLDAERENVRAAIAVRGRRRRRRHRAAALRGPVALLDLARQPDARAASCWPRRSRSTAAPPSCASARSTAPARWPASRATSRRPERCFEQSLALAPRGSATTTARRASAATSATSRSTSATTTRRSRRYERRRRVHARDRRRRAGSA